MAEYAIRLPLRYVHRLPEILHKYEASGRLARAQEVLGCTWRLHWWRGPQGRAFDLLLCELHARMHNAKVRLDVAACSLDCGAGKVVHLLEGGPAGAAAAAASTRAAAGHHGTAAPAAATHKSHMHV